MGLYSGEPATDETLTADTGVFTLWKSAADKTLTYNAWVFILGSQPPMEFWLLTLRGFIYSRESVADESLLWSLFWEVSRWWSWCLYSVVSLCLVPYSIEPATNSTLIANAWVCFLRSQPLMTLESLLYGVSCLGLYSGESASDETVTDNNAWVFTAGRLKPLIQPWLLTLGSLLWRVSNWQNTDCWRLGLYRGESATDITLIADAWVFIVASQQLTELWLLTLGSLLFRVSNWQNTDC